MTESLPSTLLARYLAGEASAAERATVESWAARDPAHRAELDRLRAAWTPAGGGDWDVERAWARVADRLDRPRAVRTWARLAERLGEPGDAVLVPRRRVLALAAGIILALGAVLVWQAVRPSSPLLVSEVATAAGERRAVDLPDGTRVTLAPASRLRVGAAYGGAERRVDLEGEGWFEVRHDAARPFRVYAAGTITEDLGTEFAVRALAADAGVRLVVVSGSASLRREGQPAETAVTLHANDVAILPPDALVPVVERDVMVAPLVAWREGRVAFEAQRLDSVAAELSRWYGLTVRLADSALASRRLTATVQLDRLEDALEVLRLSLGVRVTRRGDTVVVE